MSTGWSTPMADDDEFDLENFELTPEALERARDLSIAKLLRADPPTSPSLWQTATSEQIGEDIRKAMARLRDAVYYTPTCGSPGHPHVVHPNYWHRIMPWGEYMRLSDEERDHMHFTQCGNCGAPLPVYPGESVKFDSDPL